MIMTNITLVGAGQLGSRHLQALANVTFPCNFSVIDPHENSLKVAKERYHEVNNQKHQIQFLSNLSEVKDNNIDLAIVATNANVRYEIVSNLVHNFNLKNIILEKVVFQSIPQFEKAMDLFKKNKIKAWVNCPRRMFPFYQKLHEMLKGQENIYMMNVIYIEHY